jgi:branched-subunit amino acid ABC-type transport system permease component
MAVAKTLFRSLRWRATFWMAVFLLAIAVAIRFVNYYVTRDILLRDIDTQLWTRLGALKTQQRFAPETLLEPDLRLGGLFLPDVRTASDLEPSIGMRLLMPSAVSGQRFPWFAGVWRDDGAPVRSLRLPDGFSWQPQWRDRMETIWTTAAGDLRLAACRGSDGTVLLVGTSLDQVRRALRDVLWFHAWTVMLAMPPLALAMWWAFARTRWGMLVRMAGDSAHAARALGYSVSGIRIAATTAGGFIAGLGGAPWCRCHSRSGAGASGPRPIRRL